ncbi:unnamed protein product [Adineta steineri]|uniref:N-acetyltransferase domain-containing protein n=1 Tax=Adineta steineri TaxID=433720 RepID=A0A815B173_9BILA|nr:unnamed protein product [Adineta steineri]CAF1417031.1 unnamed protein product [Adineta steineri]
MSTMKILTNDIEPSELSESFCENQKSFYSYIANYAASDPTENGKDIKPLRFHKIENIINCIFSPNMHWSFYNAILDTDICNTIKQYHRNDSDKIIKQILSLASQYKCPVRVQVKPTASDTQNLLQRYRFIELPMKTDTFQYIDFYDNKYVLENVELNPNIKIYELDDSTQTNCEMRKFEWGSVLCESFGFKNPEIHGPFYSNVWSKVEVGPTKPLRMFVAVKNDRVVGGSHINLAHGIACLYNVTTVKSERGQGIGKALSVAAMICAKESNYRYMVLQASDMGSPVYKKLGFKPIPSYKLFIKLGTAAWYFKVIEIILAIIGIQRLLQFISLLKKPSKTFISIMVLVMVIFIAILLK